jgi:predicted dithiol-disulfide oxidoreductase (DUF899 family)
MSLPNVVSRHEWLAARKELLAREKEMTRKRDALNTARRDLPMVKIEKEYVLEGPEGPARLIDMFSGYRQLILQHFMFDPSWDEGCQSCTAGVDEISDGMLRHLRARQTTYVLVSRAPLAKLEKYKQAKGWKLPWYSSYDTDFNYDFNVTLDASKAPVTFNYRDPDELEAAGLGWVLKTEDQPMEQPGVSFFLRDGDDVFHTYSTFARGTEASGGSYGLLDLTALGRQEEWEEPKGRAADPHGNIPNFAA